MQFNESVLKAHFFGPCSLFLLEFYFLISSNFAFQRREKEQGDYIAAEKGLFEAAHHKQLRPNLEQKSFYSDPARRNVGFFLLK